MSLRTDHNNLDKVVPFNGHHEFYHEIIQAFNQKSIDDNVLYLKIVWTSTVCYSIKAKNEKI